MQKSKVIVGVEGDYGCGYRFSLLVDLNFLTTINDVVVGDDVTIRGNGKSTSRGRRDNLIVLLLSFLCFTFCLASFFYLWVFPCVLKLTVLVDAFLNCSIGIGGGALSVG